MLRSLAVRAARRVSLLVLDAQDRPMQRPKAPSDALTHFPSAGERPGGAAAAVLR